MKEISKVSYTMEGKNKNSKLKTKNLISSRWAEKYP
jgi:hypothetical protein